VSAVAAPASQAILFDLDDTLVPWQTPAHWQWAWHPQGPILSERHARAAIKRSLHAWDRRRWEGLVGTRPATTLADYRQHLKETLAEIAGHSLPGTEVEAVVDRFLHPAGVFESYPDAQPTIDALVARGERVGVVTQLPEAVARNALKRAGLADSLLVLHGEESPDSVLPFPAAFRVACGRLNVKPKGTRYVGDLFWSDVRAAGRAGLDAILLDRSDAWSRISAQKIRTLRDVLTQVEAPSKKGPSTEEKP
jgi:FMN phosphatase YigB (HAD superfamily)